ncbi:MAG TPA: hypothetical protein VMR45_00230 [Patescibacteria group bacterium]|nr:hypothetical protein [Patescibacteria group bacterium]
MQPEFGDDPMDEYSKPVEVKTTKLSKIFTLREKSKPEKPGRAISVIWDERLPLVGKFINRYS